MVSIVAKKDEKAERISRAKESAKKFSEEMIEALKEGKGELLQQWAETCAQFHKYSFHNQILIEEQAAAKGFRPSLVASFNEWLRKGEATHGKPYVVKRGQSAIWIWAPRPYTRKGKKEDEEERAHVGFVLVPVFDAMQIAQGVDPEKKNEDGTPYVHPPLPSFFSPLAETEEIRGVYDALTQVISADGFLFIESDTMPSWSTQGFQMGNVIAVREGLDASSLLLVGVHEYAHAKLHKGLTEDELGKRDREGEAELTAYVVGSHFGVQSPFSADYLLSWGNTPESLSLRLGRVQKLAHEIILAIEEQQAKRGEERDEESAGAA